jgi:hypothetical protein
MDVECVLESPNEERITTIRNGRKFASGGVARNRILQK